MMYADADVRMRRGEGVSQMRTKADKGGKNHQIFVDFLYG